ncbi:hypothetical protein BDQ17DRAFT_1391209 [Cyathus striatus]|nr:hypothetical protein BDQ17DRAFT_1391209 [Cyathus striatus]
MCCYQSPCECAIRKYGIAGRVWEATYALALYVSPGTQFDYDPPFLPSDTSLGPITIIELGAGTGMLSAFIAEVLDCSKDTLIVTDLPEVSLQIFVLPLSWGNIQHVVNLENKYLKGRPLTHIICSDLVYFPELLGPLLRTLIHLTSSNCDRHRCASPPTIVISYKIRSLLKETPFWSAFGLWFDWYHVGSDFDDRTFIFVAQRRPQSYSWDIPSEDDSLLHGVGAYGKETRQADDTFELMLLMSLEIDIIE